ncbi:myosin-binding protein H-like [Lepisosteus oculatus]|uniref:myosin-binding protein H-like n=1 Tax=Lepisosteus oculatus TaxID=7918 RepID=UPI00073FDD9A|nr:PREDICTED: myosin light chain kinase, smooth muscle-like [Lepisosteus oculatus]
METYAKEFRSVEEPSYEYSAFEGVSEKSTIKKIASVKMMEAGQVTIVTKSETIAPKSPTLLLKLNDLRVKVGGMAQFICSFDGQPFTEIVWEHNGRRLMDSERAKYSQNGGALCLSIFNVQLADQGCYRCTVKNKYGEETTSAQLSVEAKEAKAKADTQIPSDSGSKSSKTDKVSHIMPSDQDKQELPAKTTGSQLSTAQRPSGTQRQKSRDYYPDVVPCEEPEMGATIPEFLEKLSPEITVQEGDDVSLFCVIKGIPAPCVIWLYNQLIVQESASYSLKHDGSLCSLNIKKIDPSQGGTYICKIVNSAGEAACSTHLRVTGWQLHVLVLQNVNVNSSFVSLFSNYIKGFTFWG